MRKVLTVLLLSTLAIGTASAETLHFGTTTANPPFVTANGKNQPVGFDIDPRTPCASRCRRSASSRRSVSIP